MRQRSPLYHLLLLLDNHPPLFFSPLMLLRQVVAISSVLLLQLISELLTHVSDLLPPTLFIFYVPLLLFS